MLKQALIGTYALLLLFSATKLDAQPGRVPAVDNHQRVTLSGHVPSRATPENDQGLAEDSLVLRNLTLVLKPSPAQQAGLEALLARQQDPSSPDYHRWLTPEDYAARFGLSQPDLDRITRWLQSVNLRVISVARGRNAVSFTGSARDVESAFQTKIHRYNVNGERHFANANEPSIPSALNGVVAAIHGLNDFRPQARKLRYTPLYTSGVTGNHYLAPDDIAAIYDLKPLYNTGINGTGQKIAVVGQTQINLNDIQQFRTAYNLPPSDPQVVLVPGFPDPGVSGSDLDEANLDIEWSGAVARNASIVYAYSYDVTDALHYVIDQNLAPVLSMSYGLCEALTGTADLKSLQLYAQRANSQGITWTAASGDSGGADCFGSTNRTTSTRFAVDSPASIPEVTGVGGTEFNEGSGSWWTSTNNSSQASAFGYIPEMVWNDSVSDGSPSSGGGGVSSFFPKPSWQTGTGVPNDSFRDVPDVSFAASADHDGYLFYSAGARGAVGGTSVSSPVFAGMVALLNQYQLANGFQTEAGQGNINPRLYTMAQTSPGVFHDITTGDNIVTPCASVRNCTAAAVGSKAGPGYDTAAGLGSVDAFNLITAWHVPSGSASAAATVTVTSSAATLPLNGSAVLTATVAGLDSGTPTGKITWSLSGATLGTSVLTSSGGTGTAIFTVQGSALTPGDLSISALYSGNYPDAAATVNLTVTPSTPITIAGVTNAASFKQAYAPGMIMAIFGAGLADAPLSAPFVPLPTQLNHVAVTINGLLCPLYFISPSQLNVQIPYSVQTGSATLKVSYNGQSATLPLNITAAAPGIFTDPVRGGPVPGTVAKRGETITLFVTGEGAVTPAPVTGTTPTPATVPKPTQDVAITVGNVNVTSIPYRGIPAWAIGLTQFNYTVPLSAPLGQQPVIVTIGGVPSQPVTLTVTE
jgi:uncharacterized protein (TIGR03437 family)